MLAFWLQDKKSFPNEDGEGLSSVIKLWSTSGYQRGDGNVVAEDNERITEVIIHEKRAEFVIWHPIKSSDSSLSACIIQN